jgi:hypothetical protein
VYITVVFLFIAFAYSAEPELIWFSGFPSAGESVIRDSAESPGGSIITVGEASSGIRGEGALNLAAFKHDGTLLWERTAASLGSACGYRIVPCNGDFLVCGSLCNEVSSNGFVMKIDSLGNTLWLVSEGYSEDDAFSDLCLTEEGGIIAVGYSYNSETRDRDVFAVCFSDSGSVVWSRRFPETGYQTASALAPVNGEENAYLITGTDGSDIFLMKVLGNGDWAWKTRYFQEGCQIGSGILPVSGGGCLVTGSTRTGMGFSDALVVSFDMEGKVSSELSWGEEGPDMAYEIRQVPPAGFVILVNSNRGDGNGYRPVLCRFDPWFSKLWQVEASSIDALCYSIVSTSDGGFLLSGKHASQDSTCDYSSYIVKLSPEDLLNWD